MSVKEFPGRTRSVRAIATDKAEALLQSTGMTTEFEHYGEFLATLTKIYEEEQNTIQVLLVIAENLKALTANHVITPDQHVRLRGLANGPWQVRGVPNMKVMEAFAAVAIRAAMGRAKSNLNAAAAAKANRKITDEAYDREKPLSRNAKDLARRLGVHPTTLSNYKRQRFS